MLQIKVLRIIDRLNVGGPSIHCILLTAYLHKDKFSSCLVTGTVSECEGDMEYLAKQHSVVPITIPKLGREISFLRDISTLWQLIKIIHSTKPDIIHTHKSKAGAIGRLAAVLCRIPILVHTFHGHVFHHYFGWWKTCFFLMIERFLARFCAKIIVISQQQLQEICEQYRIAPRHKFCIIPLGFDFSLLDDCPKYKGWLRENFAIPQHAILVALVGRCAPVKNHAMFLEVAKELRDNTNFHFVIIGDGECRSGLEKQTEDYNLSRVTFTGWLKNPAQIYSDVDIVAITSHNEGTPVTLIEGMYCKKPVIATNVGGVKDIIDDKQNGFLIPPGNVSEFVRCLLQLASPDVRSQMGIVGHTKAIQFGMKRLLLDIEELYQKLYSEKNSVSQNFN